MTARDAAASDLRRLAWEHRTSPTLAVCGVLFLTAYSVFVLVVEPEGWLVVVLAAVGIVTWAAFFIDMVARVALTERGRRWRFVLTHPIDVLSVFLPLFRVLRVAALLQHIPLLREKSGAGVRGSVIAHALIYALVFVYAIALTTLQAERDVPEATITTFGDALWWSVVTIATVGYGDTYPITAVGRVLATMLMAGGIVIVGTTSAIVVSYISERIAANRAGNAAVDQAPSSVSSTS
ncbi:MAG: ion channel [Microcella sp.]|nr:ion channel [Microcella sp.]